MKKSVLAIAVSLVLFSCEKKELPVPKHTKVDITDTTSHTAGQLQTTQVDLGESYKTQIWFSLGENRVVATNFKTDWDLAFETSANGFHILLNGSLAMKVYKTNHTNLSQVNDTAGLGVNGKADMPSGNLDSTAIGDWQSDNKVYVVNRGYNEQGFLMGYYKLKITGVTTTQYAFEYGDVFGQQVFQGTVNKDAGRNFVGYSFTTHQSAVQVEPKKTDYDLCFTAYTHLFYEPAVQYYQVTGALGNSYKTRVARITDKAFETIVLKDTLGRSFSTRRDRIGYDWKTFSGSVYIVNPAICYIIHDSKGYYYKLHFIDFYNTAGLKGAPKFEFKRL
jgi:hypothetical protein